MYQEHKTYIKENMKVAELLNENPGLLILLEHLNIDFKVGDKTVLQLCNDNSIPVNSFITFANLYNGFNPNTIEVKDSNEILLIIKFLKNSHHYYKTDKYPEILAYINKLKEETGNNEISLIKHFFEDYFNEVIEHLDYEDKTAFPYFESLIKNKYKNSKTSFSAKEYINHHTDIESKLTDLKNLLLKHINISNNLSIRRKLFLSLIELEFDMYIHATVEEKILVPLISELENVDE